MTEVFDHPYASFLSRVSKPTRYTGTEYGSRRKDWQSAEARVCLAFPDIYDIGMSHLGFRILYRILNDDPRTLAERCYMPWVDAVREIRDASEFLRSLESQRPLCDFDVVGFSLQYELTYTNVLAMLELGGIPLRSEERSEDDPLVIAGGPVATHAEPMAPFLDAVVIGDGEELATELVLCWARGKSQKLSRRERLIELSKLTGVYVPSLYATARDPETGFEVVTGGLVPEAPFPIKRRLVEDLSKFPFPDSGPVGGPEAIFDRMSIEVTRGCTEGCRFCQAGMIYRPVRERAPEEILDTVERALRNSGQDEVSLTALSTADVSCISPLIKSLVKKTAPERVNLSVASLRAYGLAPELLDEMRKVRAGGLTFAPEAGTQRMRDVVNKNVTEEQLLETAERVFSRGFDKMKLYFMVGLPTEEDTDVEGIVEVGKRALAVGKKHLRGRARITVSVSTHVPKPHTPFQWCAMDPIAEITRKQALLREKGRGARGLELKVHFSRSSVLEGVLARGDRALADVIERAYLAGAIFDSWEEQAKLELWEEAFDFYRIDAAIDTNRYLGTIPVTARLPWDHIDVGLAPGFLAREYRRALKGRLSPPCGKVAGMFIHHTNSEAALADKRRLVCYDCGVACDLDKMRSDRVLQLRTLEARDPTLRAKSSGADANGTATNDAEPSGSASNGAQPANTAPNGADSNGTGPNGAELHDASETVVNEGNGPSALTRPAIVREPEAYRPAPVGGDCERFRLRFAKLGATALLGHLDLMRELPRVIRRAGIRTAYTRGFRPKPEMSFGPALALGVVSLDEYADIGLRGAPEPDELVRRLNLVTAPGLEFLGARRLLSNEKSPSASITGARYAIVFSHDVLHRALGGMESLTRDVESRKTASEHIERVAVDGDPGAGPLAHAGLPALDCAIIADVKLGQAGSIKPVELAQILLGSRDLPYRLVRLALLTQGEGLMVPVPAKRPELTEVRDAGLSLSL